MTREGQYPGEQRPSHHRVLDGWAVGSKDRCGLVQRAPPHHREVDERDLHGPDDSEHRGAAGSGPGIIGRASQGQVPDVDEEHHRSQGESRIPCPPHAPGGLGPDHAEGDGERGEVHPDLGTGGGEPIPDQVPGEEVAGAAHQGRREGEVGEPGGRHVDVHDADQLALYGVRGADHGQGERHRHRQTDCHPGPASARYLGRHQVSWSGRAVATPTTAATSTTAAISNIQGRIL